MDNPCDTCLRWYECNGIDKENCPLWGNEHKKEYSYWDYSRGHFVTVYRCQCRTCNKIEYLPFNGKELVN